MPNISEKIKWDFSQIKTGLIAFMTDIEKKIHELLPNIPVYVVQTGDTSFYTDLKFQEIENKEIYLKVPRITINFDDIQFQTDQYTNQYNVLEYKYKGKLYECKTRRLSLLIPVTINIVSSNFLLMLENYELISTILVRPNVLTYEFLGSNYEVAYQFQANGSGEIPNLDYNNQTKNQVNKFQIELQLQILVPRVETIQEYVRPDELTVKTRLISKATINTETDLNQ